MKHSAIVTMALVGTITIAVGGLLSQLSVESDTPHSPKVVEARTVSNAPKVQEISHRVTKQRVMTEEWFSPQKKSLQNLASSDSFAGTKDGFLIVTT